ncbi:hypothetical protein [Pectinatus frisingensis]|uniref:hypothetical protein n=1 Tax=Pectinatus frisingensis TaxID=865 RepID=UPI003D803A8C
MISFEQRKKILLNRKKNRQNNNVIMKNHNLHVEYFDSFPQDTKLKINKEDIKILNDDIWNI